MADQNIKILFGQSFHKSFDEIINCKLVNREGDAGLVETERPALHPRDGAFSIGNTIAVAYSGASTYQIGNIVHYNSQLYRAKAISTNILPTVTANWDLITQNIQSDNYIYQDRTYTTREFRTFINSTNVQVVQYLNTSNVWTDIFTIPANGYTSPHKAVFNTVNVPQLSAGGNPTAFTTPSVATAAERIKKNAGDTLNANNNVGKIAMIFDGVYEGCYATIISWDSVNSEYVLSGSGIITALASGSTYRLFDRLDPCLQVVTNGKDYYFNGITQLSIFDGKALNSLVKVFAVDTKIDNGFVFFKNVYWTFANASLFFAGGTPGNAFFYNLVNVLTLASYGPINLIYVFKNRLIILGQSYIASYDQNLLLTRHTSSFGGVAIASSGDDAYLLTSDNRVVSLAETISGSLSLTDFSYEAYNYISKFDNTNKGLAFDGQNLYIFGSTAATGYAAIVIFNVQYKYWSIYDGLRVRQIFAYSGKTYFVSDNTDQVFNLVRGQLYDALPWGNTVFNQQLSTKEIDIGDIFTTKKIRAVYVSHEDITQALLVRAYMALNGNNAAKQDKKVSFTKKEVVGVPLGGTNLGNGTFGGNGNLSQISIPTMYKISYAIDSVNTFKIFFFSTDSRFFYINQIDIGYEMQDPKSYFSKVNTI